MSLFDLQTEFCNTPLPCQTEASQNQSCKEFDPNSFTALIDYLTFTGSLSSPSEILELSTYVIDVFSLPLFFRPGAVFRGRAYDYSLVSPLGDIELALSLIDDPSESVSSSVDEIDGLSSSVDLKSSIGQLPAGAYKFRLNIPGSTCRSISLASLILFCQEIVETREHDITRLDIKLRDYLRTKSPSQLHSYLRRGNFGRIKTYGFAGSGSRVPNGEIVETETVYMGSPKSDKRLRVYDALPVHDENCIDWELQCRRHYAKECLKFLTDGYQFDEPMPDTDDMEVINSYLERLNEYNDSDETHDVIVSKLICRLVLSHIEFVDRGSNGNLRLSRSAPMRWWTKFKNRLDGAPIRLTVTPLKPSIPKKMAWLRRQVSKSLYMVASTMPSFTFAKYLDDLLHFGEDKMSKSDNLFLQSEVNLINSGSDSRLNPLINKTSIVSEYSKIVKSYLCDTFISANRKNININPISFLQ